MGIKNIAVDSDRQIFESKKVEKARQHYNKQRSILQKVGTKSAKRKLKKISGKERRFKKDTNHFECLQCGYKEMADYIAAKNIAA